MSRLRVCNEPDTENLSLLTARFAGLIFVPGHYQMIRLKANHNLLLKLSAFDLKELDLLTFGFVCHSTQEAVRSATTRNQAIFV